MNTYDNDNGDNLIDLGAMVDELERNETDDGSNGEQE
jgi:hypothetical protein